VLQEEWDRHTPPFVESTGLRIATNPDGPDDYLVNMGNTYLKTELRAARPDNHALIAHQFKWGLAVAAIGMIQHEGKKDETERLSKETLNGALDGLAAVIVPIIRYLSQPVG
ncbi:MAG: hypothetical protein AB7G21_08930, partial [Dehalococcoidia bacterium]